MKPNPVVGWPFVASDARGLSDGPVVGLVGRKEELARLRGLVARVAGGRGSSVWLAGEPGIGKSALLTAGMAEARPRGCQVFGTQAVEFVRLFPLRVLLDALRVGPGAQDAVRAEIATTLWGRRSIEAVTTGDAAAAACELLLVLVEQLCNAGPVVLVVDDLHWADEMSLAVWARLHRVVGQLPLLLVAAARPVPLRAELDRLHHAVAADGLMLDLGPLTNSQVAELVGQLVAATTGPGLLRLAGQTGGNPLYVRELVDALQRERRVTVHAGVAELVDGAATAPVSLAAAVAARLGFLSGPATEVLRMAALLGGDFDLAHLRVLTGRSVTDLVDVVREASAAGVLAESGTRLMFRHAVIRQALYEATPVALRAALHRQAAHALAIAGAPAEQVAEQLLSSPRADATTTDGWMAGWVTEAAHTLVNRAPRVAVDLLERVRPAIGGDDPRREQLDAHLATALFRLGRYGHLEPLASHSANIRDPAVAGRIAWTLGYALVRMGRYEQAMAVTSRALGERTLPGMWIARIRAVQALSLLSWGRFEEAQAAARLAQGEAERVGDWLGVGYALHALALVEIRHHQNMDALLAIVDRALVVIGQEPETTDLRLALLGNRATALADLGRTGEAGRALGQAVALAEQAGAPTAYVRMQHSEHSFFTGQWDDAIAELDTAADRPLDVGLQLWRRGLLALIAVHRDDRAAVDTHLRVEHVQLPAAASNYYGTYLRIARALASERDHRPDQALAQLLEIYDPDSTLGFRELAAHGPRWLPDVVRLALSEGQRAIADAAAAACDAEARRHPLPETVAGAQHCRGLMEANPALLLSAADTYRAASVPLYQAQALENAAVLLASRGDRQAARATYSDAAQTYIGLDAAWDVLRADARLRPLGIRRGVRGPRRRPASGWNALTATERKIAGLVAAGNSNADIAIELFLSRATVTTHIGHILTKLNADSRVDIAREVTSRHNRAAESTPSYLVPPVAAK